MFQRWSRIPNVRGPGLKKVRGLDLGPTFRGQAKGLKALKRQRVPNC